jgi:hypothetical protein
MQETREEVAPKKGRYCVKCKKHVPVNYFVWQDGTTHQTMCNRHELEHKLDSDGLRYCKVCDNFIALDLFPKTGRTRYMCKKHIYETDNVRRNKPDQKRRLRQWKMCWTDSKKFKQTSIGMTQAEVDDKVAEFDSDRKYAYAVMPIDTGGKITPDNCVVVTLETRRRLMRFVDENDLEAYAQMVARICTKK